MSVLTQYIRPTFCVILAYYGVGFDVLDIIESQTVMIFHESNDLTGQNTTPSPTAAGRESHQAVFAARLKHNLSRY